MYVYTTGKGLYDERPKGQETIYLYICIYIRIVKIDYNRKLPRPPLTSAGKSRPLA